MRRVTRAGVDHALSSQIENIEGERDGRPVLVRVGRGGMLADESEPALLGNANGCIVSGAMRFRMVVFEGAELDGHEGTLRCRRQPGPEHTLC